MTLHAVENGHPQPPPTPPDLLECDADTHPDGRCRHHWTLGVAGVLRCVQCSVSYNAALNAWHWIRRIDHD